jgi:hypothetical protein
MAQFLLFSHSQFTHGPLTLHSLPIAVHSRSAHAPFTVRSQFTHGPLTLHSLSARGSLTARSRSIHCPLTVHPRSGHAPFTVRSWFTHGPVTLHSLSARGSLTVRSRSIHCPLTVHSRSGYGHGQDYLPYLNSSVRDRTVPRP